ncbi:E3 ubiquitin-protein ligase MARCH5-like [Scleropages formosus]|uniref:E3 ubiquitin-protein ligase MARCHF5 n=1 Tax=Scleropages formosus TaxID=113540 RepID=A0A0P7XVQ3_SCLFO|nr:E3 ubiquitin-protein ligase MARCH5-like [Scleropages formosus]
MAFHPQVKGLQSSSFPLKHGARPTLPSLSIVAASLFPQSRDGSCVKGSFIEQIKVLLSNPGGRSCWVCFATDEDDRTAEWVRPCRCRGSTKWVHQACLQRWVDEKQRGNSTARVACPQCNAEYLIVFPKLASESERIWRITVMARVPLTQHVRSVMESLDMQETSVLTARVHAVSRGCAPTGPVVYVLDLADRLISKACPFAAAGIMVGSIYWTAVTYGAVTVMQVVGHKEGLDVMERADPLFLLIGLPTIPVMLILGKMIRWEDYVLRLWRKYSTKLQILNSIFPGIGCPVPRIPAEASPLADHVSATRILCGALVFPTIATIVGKLMFSSVNSNLQRTILGGIAFVAIKGAFKVYFKQQQYLRQAHRKILNFPEQDEA